ncbi:MAG: hypothetical protein IJ449_03880 [Clostridia bacterium]|nr:hypothetical protein [Clostridia bacterium]
MCAVFAVLLLLVAGMAALILTEMNRQDIGAGELAEVLADGTETEAITTEEITTEPVTEAVTEPPVPYYTEEEDILYLPLPHEGDPFPTTLSYNAENRVYAAMPDTDSDGFDDYCKTTIVSLVTSAVSEDTLREGGSTVVSIDYTLHTSEHVYSAAFVRTVVNTAENTTQRYVIVLIYDTETNGVYAPLDVYDMTEAATPLAALMRTGFETSFASLDMNADSAYLDSICNADPSSFVNIAMDDGHLYFYHIYDNDGAPVLLCASVSLADMEDYTWESLEIARLAAQLPPPEEEIIPIEIPTYDVSGAVPESEMVGDDYFDDALFIGNSLIVGLQKTVPLNARYFASIGLNVSQVFTKEIIPLTDGTFTTISHALELVEFKKVYLMFGVNELGWGSIASFIDYYSQIIDRIREVNPDAIIYVQSILPINEEKWAKSADYQSCINNVSVATFNQKIVEMCNEKFVCFVNVGEVLTDETGNLYSDATSDGIHIGGVFSTRWVEYLKTHTVQMTAQ